MNLLVKFISNHTDYFGQNLATAHLPREHDAGYSLKQDDQSVEEKQYKLLKKKKTPKPNNQLKQHKHSKFTEGSGKIHR